MLLIRFPETYDLVLEFENETQMSQFVGGVKKSVDDAASQVEVCRMTCEVILHQAETHETRQKKIEKFFKEAYAIAFGLKSVNLKLFHFYARGLIYTYLLRAFHFIRTTTSFCFKGKISTNPFLTKNTVFFPKQLSPWGSGTWVGDGSPVLWGWGSRP